jgi:hypothetical protein
MSRFLKSFHLAALSFGFLAAVGIAFNLIFFFILYPQVTQLLEQQPSWETYGVVAAINIIVIAFFQLFSVIALLAHLISQKKTSFLVVSAITIGIISGLMILGDITLLSDIGNEYEAGMQTRGEWGIIFASYGVHILSLVLGIIALVRNLNAETGSREKILKDEVLFLSLHATGIICGALGLILVTAGLFTSVETWILGSITGILSTLILSPYLVILAIWLLRRFWGDTRPGLDEKQSRDLASAGLTTLLITLPIMMLYYRMQSIQPERGLFAVLWMPLLLFLSLALFSSLALRSYSYN